MVVAREVELVRMIAEWRVKSKDTRRNDGGGPDKAHKCIIVHISFAVYENLFCLLHIVPPH